MPNGIVIIDKPQGWTSMDVCAKLRGILHEKRVGHAGTLDPMATGVLPVFVGQATKAVSFAEGGQKVYEAVLQLGLVTDTQDTTGETLEERAVTVTEDEVRAALPRFLGEIEQIPPMYSAIVRSRASRAISRSSTLRSHRILGTGSTPCASCARRALTSARCATISVRRSAAAAAWRRCAARKRRTSASTRP